MDTAPGRHKEQGVVFLALFVIIIIGIVVGIFFVVQRVQHKKSVTTSTAEVVSAGGSALARAAENTQRKTDASALLVAVGVYFANTGELPTSLTSELLEGAGRYTGGSVVQGEQEPLKTDELRLVTGATCVNGGATIAGSFDEYAVQYALEESNGSFSPQCKQGRA